MFFEVNIAGNRRQSGAGKTLIFLAFGAFSLLPQQSSAASTPDWSKTRPLLEKYCYDCHGGAKTKGEVDLKRLDADPQVSKEFELWNRVQTALSSGEMPPSNKPQLSKRETARLQEWLGHSIELAIQDNAGDPGPVTMRRLTNAEYDYTVRDLTGFDYQLAKEFQPDGGGGEGFANTGDVLFVNPQQLDKYLTAARKLVDHATVLPGTGITFNQQRIGLRGPDQLRAQAEQALYVWYQKMAAPYLPKDDENLREADYMLACWKFKHKELTGANSLAQLAKDNQLQPAFLENWWKLLNSTQPASRYLDLTRVPWRELPGPDAKAPKEVPAAVSKTLAEIQQQRHAWYDPKRGWASVQRMQQDADHLNAYGLQTEVKGHAQVKIAVGDVADGNRGDYVQLYNLEFDGKQRGQKYFPWLKQQLEQDKQALKKDGVANADAIKARITKLETALSLFGKHPLNQPSGAEVITVKAPTIVTLPLPEDALRFKGLGKLDLRSPESDFASAQWMATADAPPNPTNVFEGVLTVWKRQTPTHNKLMGEFSVMKTAFPDIFDRRLEEVARNYLRQGGSYGVYYFSDNQLAALIKPADSKLMKEMLEDWRFVRGSRLSPQMEKEWDTQLEKQVLQFAATVWRRALTQDEKTELTTLYHEARKRELDRESSAREVMVRTLVSPKFLFKVEPALEPGEHPLNPWQLASRLSYFLWSSMPDEALRKAAADGSLVKPEVVQAQIKRMLRDPKAGALATEFAGQWLDFNQFATHSAVDKEKFPEFTDELRQSMYEEPVKFFNYIIREDRPVREILQADYTFANAQLAKFYGLKGADSEEFQKVSTAGMPRGGILGMGSILTKTSRSHRTSPVVRGNWLLQSILGTPVPPPPSNVPELEEGGTKPATLRARLEQHRADKACSSCHDKIDPLGFALEGFDPIGRVRKLDDFNLPVDDSAEMKNGTEIKGFNGLRNYLATQEGQFESLLCRKLLGFALGRQVLPTDKPLLAQMQEALKKNDGHFSTAVITIAQSRQFQNRRNE